MAFIEKIIDGQVHYIDENYNQIMEQKQRYEEENPPNLLNISDEQLSIIMENDRRRETNKNNLQYLAETDWYLTRKNETGKEIPEEILTKRQEARNAILPELEVPS
jgi:hypothetical protein